MRHLKKYNEGIGTEIVKYSLIGSLMFGTVNAQNTNQALQSAKQISKIATDTSKYQDKELSKILNEIQDKLHSHDTAAYLNLFQQLSDLVEKKYHYKIKTQEISKIENRDIKSMSIFEILGWLGSICLAICGAPQAWMSYKDKHSHGISWAFLLLWAFGELFALAYVYDKLDAPLLLNYSINVLIIGLILYFKINPKKQ